MKDFLVLLSAAGGVAIFIYGLLKVGKSCEILASAIPDKIIYKTIKRPARGFLTGTLAAGITQSGAAVTMIAVGLAEAGAATLYNLAPLIAGANVGTTVTAQIVARTGGNYRLSAIVGALAAVAGVILFVSGKGKVSVAGEAFAGLGLMLFGINAISSRADEIIKLNFIRGISACDNPFLLFFASLALAGVTQSSSALTGMLVLLSENSIKAFYRAIFIILGSNVGSCVTVALSGAGKSVAAKQAACFNLIFNAFGAVVVFPAAVLFKEKIACLFPVAFIDAGRAIADFQTAFNFLSAVMAFPCLKPLTNITCKLVEKIDKLNKNAQKRRSKKSFEEKSCFIIDNFDDKVYNRRGK